jgi:hypothetical protein
VFGRPEKRSVVPPQGWKARFYRENDQRCTVEAASASGVVVVAGGAAQYDDARAGLRRGQAVKIHCFYKGFSALVLTSATAVTVTGSETGTPGVAERKNPLVGSSSPVTATSPFLNRKSLRPVMFRYSLPTGAAPRSAAGPAAATEHTTAEQMSYDVAIAKAPSPSNRDCTVSFGEGLAVADEGQSTAAAPDLQRPGDKIQDGSEQRHRLRP